MRRRNRNRSRNCNFDGIVGGVDLFHLCLGALVAGIDVGMILLGKPAVGFFHFFVAGIAADAQNSIRIAHGSTPFRFGLRRQALPAASSPFSCRRRA